MKNLFARILLCVSLVTTAGVSSNVFADGHESARAPGVVWFSLDVSDLETAKEFYSSIFGWTFLEQNDEFGRYMIIFQGENDIGDLMLTENPIASSATIYFQVENVIDTLGLAQTLGAETVYEPISLPDGRGMVAAFLDPFGHRIGIFSATTGS